MDDEGDSVYWGTWKFVEALGIPDSPMRTVLFKLAEFIDGDASGEQLALASAAFLALDRAFREQFEEKSTLQLQVEYLRARRDLMESIGAEMPAVDPSDFIVPALPQTAAELANQLGYDDNGRSVRATLRAGFPDHEKNSRWEPLTRDQVNYVRAHLPPRSSD